jgi:rhodanese-related sulfurtransferase
MAAGSPHQEPFQRLSPNEAREMIDKGGVQFIDVREPHEYAEGHAAGTKLVQRRGRHRRLEGSRASNRGMRSKV